MKTKTEPDANETCESIKLGIDAHAKWYYVGRQVDGATPQPVQKMSYEGLLRFVARQQRLAREVHTCYEAGPALHLNWVRTPPKGFAQAQRRHGSNGESFSLRSLALPAVGILGEKRDAGKGKGRSEKGSLHLAPHLIK